MTTPEPVSEAGAGQQEDAGQETFAAQLLEALKSPGHLVEDLIATAVENSNRRREHHEQPPGPGYARRG
jgi:hypothetical protein